MNSFFKIKILTVVLSVAAAVDSDDPQELVRLNAPLIFYPKAQDKSLFKDLGIIHPIRQCGGSGKLLQWRNEACTLHTLTGACVFPASQEYRGEVTFLPSETVESLGVRSIVKDAANGQVLSSIQKDAVENSGVEAGKAFALGGKVSLVPELRGRVVTNQVTLFRESNEKEVELCAEADFLIV